MQHRFGGSWTESQHDLLVMVQWFSCRHGSQWFFFYIWNPNWHGETSYIQIMKWYDTMIHLNIAWPTCHGSLIFCLHGPVIFVVYLKAHFDIWTSYLQINENGMTKMINPQYECSQHKLHVHGSVISAFMVQWFCHICKSPFDIWNIISSDYEMFWTQCFDLNMNVGHYDLYFHGPVIVLLYLEDHLTYATSYFPDYENSMTQPLTSIWLKVTVTYISWSSEFCPISESPFDIWTSYFQIMKWYDTVF